MGVSGRCTGLIGTDQFEFCRSSDHDGCNCATWGPPRSSGSSSPGSSSRKWRPKPELRRLGGSGPADRTWSPARRAWSAEVASDRKPAPSEVWKTILHSLPPPFPFPRNLEQGSFLVSVLLETAAARFQQISLKKGDLTWRANSADGQASVSARRGFPGRAPPKGASAGHRHGRRVQPQGRAPRSAAARRRPARASRRAILLWRACSPAVQGLTSAARAAPQRPVRFWVGR